MPWKKEWLWKKYGSTGAGSPVRAPSVFISCKDAKISVENQRPGIELAENHYCLKQTIFPPVFSSGLQWCPQPNSFPFCLSKRLLHRAKQRLKRRVRRLAIKDLGKFHKVFGGNDGGNVEFIHDHPAFGTHENGGRNPPTFFVTKPWKMVKEPWNISSHLAIYGPGN